MSVFAATLAMALPALSHPALADDGGSLTLVWEAPPECPSQTRVRGEVARLLGGTIAIPQGGTLDVQAHVDHGQAWSVSINTRQANQTGHRSIEASSCQDLADATALIIALMVDPDAVAAHARDAKAEQPAAPRAPVVVISPTLTPAHGPGRPVDFLAAIHGEGSLGVLPGLDAGIGAGIGLAGRRWRIELRGTYSLRRDQVAHSQAIPGAYGQFNFLGGALATCVSFGGDDLAFGPCGSAEVGMVSARGYGASVGFPARTTWLALGAGGYAAITIGRHLRIPLHLDIMAPLRRPEYIIKGTGGVLFQAPAVGGRLTAGIEARF